VRRIVWRLVVVLFAVVAALCIAAWLALRGSLPRYDGRIVASALAQPVAVERDANGSVTLRAQNRRDLTWTLGYVHAQERFFEMDLLRRRAAGELAELFGPVALPADRTARAHRVRARTQEGLASLSAEDQRELVAAFSDFSVATYANQFDDFSGERFEVDPKAAPAPGNDVIVKTKLIQSNGEPVQLDYLLRQEQAEWRIIDVFLSGTISQLAARRSEFSGILREQGARGLIAVLRQKTKALASGNS